MQWQAWFTLITVGAAVALLAKELIAPSAVVFGATILLLLVGIITPDEAFAGFSNSAPFTVAALFVVARAVEKTGGLGRIIDLALGSGTGIRRPLARLCFLAASASAFLNNTPIVAMLVGPVTAWAEQQRKSPSHFLMPLSFAVILGGTVTAIGTSTNLLVSGLLQQYGEVPFGLFEFTSIGLPLAVIGVVLLVILTPIVLPPRRQPRGAAEQVGREFVVQMDVVRGGPLDGKSIETAGLRHLEGVYLVQVDRGGEVTAPVDPRMALRGGDRLTFVGRGDLVLDLHARRGLVSAERPHVEAFDTERNTFFEVVIGAASPLVGKSLKESGFRSRYQAAVVAIHRAGHRVNEKLGQVELKVGDTLLLLTDPSFRDRWRDRTDFLVVSRVRGTPPSATRKAWIAGLVTILIALTAGTGLLSMIEAALVGAFALVAGRVLTAGEARSAVDLDVVVLIAAAFGLATAIEKTGLAALLGSGMVNVFGTWGVTGALVGIVIATMLLSEIIGHNPAAVMMLPIGMSAARALGAAGRPFGLAIAVAASMTFLLPIPYATNTMVYGPGGYRFGDYARLGAAVALLCVIGIPLLVRR